MDDNLVTKSVCNTQTYTRNHIARTGIYIHLCRLYKVILIEKTYIRGENQC